MLLHAGVVVRGPHCLVLPGRAEAGKSTLVAGLVRAGWGYGSDELALLSFTDERLKPYQRPISIDVGAYDIFPELIGPIYRTTDEQWQRRVLLVERRGRPGSRCVARRTIADVISGSRMEPTRLSAAA